ncbi:MAG TPA: LysR family transcriptional regulator, partial [Labilithrix sp.]|nr:LysR family transcriptional regulator [Labilithrix sp.]
MDTGRIDFNRVAMFVQIANAGGVTAAATKLKLPKSSVSRGLSQLEAELGVELVVRSTRRFRLTEAGRSFFEAASKGIE